MLPIKNRYDEMFEIEIDGWCYGLSNFSGEVEPAIVFRVVSELSPAYQKAVECNYIFDILDVSARVSKAAKYLIKEKEITFAILSCLPSPGKLDEDAQFVLAQIVDQVEQAYGGALERLQKKWAWEKNAARNAANAANSNNTQDKLKVAS